jgi:DNA-binding NarL/FixJ family response regulator
MLISAEDRMDRNHPTKVLLADDHTMFREGLAGLLASYGGLEVVAQVPNEARVPGLTRELAPDVLIMQVQRPFERAKETLIEIRSFPDPPKVVVVTMFEDPREMRELLRLGASAYVLKSSSSGQLMGAVRAAVFDPKGENVVVGMPREALEEAEDPAGELLSARELEILLLASRGLSNGQIAARVHLAEVTVKRHLANVYQKMGVGSRDEATRMALREEWITIQDVTDDLDGTEGETEGEQ